MKSKPFLLLFLFVSPLYTQESQRIDSLLKAYTSHNEDSLKVKTIANLYNAYLYNDATKAKNFAFEELQLSQKLDYPAGKAMALYHLGAYYSNLNLYDSAIFYYKKAFKDFRDLGDLEKETDVNHGLAIVNYYQGNYEEALAMLNRNESLYKNKLNDSASLAITYDLKGSINTYMGNHNIALKETLKALQIFDRIEKPIRKADALNHLATTEFYLGNYRKSLQYNQEAYAIYLDHNDKGYQSQALNDIGNTYFYLREYDKAMDYLNQSLSLSKEMDYVDLEATALGNIGKTYAAKKEFSKAVDYLNKGLAIVEQTNTPNKIAEALLDLSRIYNDMRRPEQAIPHIDRALGIAEEIGSLENLRGGYLQKSIAYEQLGAYDKAYTNHKQYKAISDSIFDTTKSQQIEEMRTIYEIEKKEQQIVMQQQEIDLLEQKAEINSLQRMLLGGGLVLAVLGFYGVRQKMKRNRIAKEKVEAELAFKKKELTTHALHLAKKNETLESLKSKAQELKKNEGSKNGYQQLIRTIDFDLQDDNNWENFSRYFEEVHKDFNSTVKSKFPEVTSNELRLMALLKMNLSSKEIANILNISQEGIKKARYRLRKKLDITTEESLQDLVLSL